MAVDFAFKPAPSRKNGQLTSEWWFGFPFKEGQLIVLPRMTSGVADLDEAFE